MKSIICWVTPDEVLWLLVDLDMRPFNGVYVNSSDPLKERELSAIMFDYEGQIKADILDGTAEAVEYIREGAYLVECGWI